MVGGTIAPKYDASQCSPVWKTGTMWENDQFRYRVDAWSQCSPVWKTGTMSNPADLQHHQAKVSM